MQVIVKILPGTASALSQRGPLTTKSGEPLRMVEALGVTIEPMHQGTSDPDLMTYFIVEVPDLETAQRVINRLQQSTEIEAAYLKPPDEPP